MDMTKVNWWKWIVIIQVGVRTIQVAKALHNGRKIGRKRVKPHLATLYEDL